MCVNWWNATKMPYGIQFSVRPDTYGFFQIFFWCLICIIKMQNFQCKLHRKYFITFFLSFFSSWYGITFKAPVIKLSMSNIFMFLTLDTKQEGRRSCYFQWYYQFTIFKKQFFIQLSTYNVHSKIMEPD